MPQVEEHVPRHYKVGINVPTFSGRNWATEMKVGAVTGLSKGRACSPDVSHGG